MLAIMVAEYTYKSLNNRSCTKENPALITLSAKIVRFQFLNTISNIKYAYKSTSDSNDRTLVPVMQG